MNRIAAIGDNRPPSEMEILREEFGLSEVENWLDGSPVEDDGQMAAVDALIATVKSAEKAAKDRKEADYRPHKDACDAVVEAWKPVLDDLSRMKSGLLSIVDTYKKRRWEEQEAARKAKEAEAERLKREAEHVQSNVDMGDIQQRREADEISLEARKAEKAAQDVEKVKGLRTRTVVEISDGRACINWIAVNDKPALSAFMLEYAEKKTREGVTGIAGVTVRKEKYAV